MTAHYNAYFNGKESLRQGVEELETNVKDNYMEVLPVYKLGKKEDAGSIKPYMDRAIEKGSKVIKRHSMNFNRKEFVRWIDESYLLMGKANYYKQDYLAAKRTFDFVLKKYEAPEKHEATLWLARTLIQREEYNKAQSTLDQLQNKIDGGEEVRKSTLELIPLTYAELFIRQEKYGSAIEYLKYGIEVIGKKQLKTRLIFILAQIYQKEGVDYKATELYTQVIKRNPEYEMAFNARINLATAFDVNSGDTKLVYKELNKLLNDSKNEDYKDQIYYALAQLALKEQNDTLARQYLKQSVASSFGNDFQKAISSLKLANLYFDDPDYRNAQVYYDTTTQFLPLEYPEYGQIEKRTYTLTDLVEHLDIVHTEDSLQYLAGLPEDERNQIVNDIIAKVKEEQERMREEERERQQSMAFMKQNRMSSSKNTTNTGGWYFYNPSSMSFGYSEFMKKWGRRKLEDLWRLSDKRVVDFGTDEFDELATDSTMADTVQYSTDPLLPKTYLQHIPLTDEQKEVSNKKIAESLYRLGFIYKEGLNENRKAVESFESFVSRYPENDFAIRCYFQLYLLYQELDDQANVDRVKGVILSEYPDTDYARLIEDPSYYQQLLEEQNRVNTLYTDAYQAFEDGQYFTTVIYSEEALMSYPKDDLAPKFTYLRALAKGKMEHQDSLIVCLREMVRKYPASDVTPLAREILNRFNISPELTVEEKQAKEEEKQLNAAMELYAYEPSDRYLYLMIVKSGEVNINATKVKVSDHNNKYSSLETYRVNSVLLNSSSELITVGTFENEEKALDYLMEIENSTYVFSDISSENYEHFIISTKNYPVFYKDKNIQMYRTFFQNTFENRDE